MMGIISWLMASLGYPYSIAGWVSLVVAMVTAVPVTGSLQDDHPLRPLTQKSWRPLLFGISYAVVDHDKEFQNPSQATINQL